MDSSRGSAGHGQSTAPAPSYAGVLATGAQPSSAENGVGNKKAVLFPNLRTFTTKSGGTTITSTFTPREPRAAGLGSPTYRAKLSKLDERKNRVPSGSQGSFPPSSTTVATVGEPMQHTQVNNDTLPTKAQTSLEPKKQQVAAPIPVDPGKKHPEATKAQQLKPEQAVTSKSVPPPDAAPTPKAPVLTEQRPQSAITAAPPTVPDGGKPKQHQEDAPVRAPDSIAAAGPPKAQTRKASNAPKAAKKQAAAKGARGPSQATTQQQTERTITSLTDRLDNREKHNRSLLNKVAELEKQVASLKATVDIQRDDIARKNTDLIEARSALAVRKEEDTAGHVVLEDRITDLEIRNADLCQSLAMERHSLEDVTMDEYGARTDLEALQENYEALEQNHAALEQSHETLQHDHTALQQSHGFLQQNHGALQQNYGTMWHDCEGLQQENGDLRKALQSGVISISQVFGREAQHEFLAHTRQYPRSTYMPQVRQHAPLPDNMSYPMQPIHEGIDEHNEHNEPGQYVPSPTNMSHPAQPIVSDEDGKSTQQDFNDDPFYDGPAVPAPLVSAPLAPARSASVPAPAPAVSPAPPSPRVPTPEPAIVVSPKAANGATNAGAEVDNRSPAGKKAQLMNLERKRQKRQRAKAYDRKVVIRGGGDGSGDGDDGSALPPDQADGWTAVPVRARSKSPPKPKPSTNKQRGRGTVIGWKSGFSTQKKKDDEKK